MGKLSDELREQIEQDIATGALKPGTHLDETELAERFKVSRTPIREAISMLAGEGLVEYRPRRGAVVVQITPERLIEMFEVMAELEAMCARLAARRISAEQIAQLQAVHQQCEKAAAQTDSDAYFYANEEFHKLIYTFSRNTFLAQQACGLQRKLRTYRRLQLRVKNRLQKSLSEHEQVLNALKLQQEMQAANLLRNHVIVQGERFADLVASLAQMETS